MSNDFYQSTPVAKETFATMNTVVMYKNVLIEHLVTNKAKHDTILQNAIAGYWELAQNKLEAKKQKLLSQLEEYKSQVNFEFDKFTKKIENQEVLPHVVSVSAFNIDTNIGLTYPEDHTQDYERAISMMEASVYDKVELSTDEYDAYVLNNWGWKSKFILSNTAYVNAAISSNKFQQVVFSGQACPNSTGYNTSAEAASKIYGRQGLTSKNF
jgi:hypothetical protein